MKKLLSIISVVVISSSVSFAEIKLLESATIKQNALKALLGANFIVNTFCVDGYKFVMSKGGTGKKSSSRTMVQAFEERDGKSLPAKC